MTDQEIKDNYEELEAILVRRFPPEEHGEDSDLSSICTLAQELRDEALRRTLPPEIKKDNSGRKPWDGILREDR